MTNSVSGFWPVNSLGEIIFETGVGDTTNVGYLPSHFIPQDPTTKAVPAVGLGAGSNTLVKPSGDTTGVTDRQTIANAIVTASAKSGNVELAAGQWYVASTDVGTTNTDKGIPLAANVTVFGQGRRKTNIKVVGGSKCNIFVAENINNWSLRNLYMDGNRTDPAMPITGGSQDSLRNCVRIVSCTGWAIDDCTMASAAYHAFIGVGTIANGSVTNCYTTGNGFRSGHLHDESGAPGKIVYTNNVCDGDGQSIFVATHPTAQVQAGALTKLRLLAADAANLATCYANSITTVTVAIPGAGASGATHYSSATLSPTNPDVNNDLTLATSAVQAASPVVCPIFTGGTSGVFLAFGCSQMTIEGNQIYNMPGIGMHLSGSPNATTGRIIMNGNLIDGCGMGISAGGLTSSWIIDEIDATGNVVTNSTFNGMELGNIKNFSWVGKVNGSGMAGIKLTTVGTAMEYARIGGVLSNNGAMGFYGSGSGEIGALKLDADLIGNGANAGFSASTTIFGADGQGWTMGAKVTPSTTGLYHSVVVDVGLARKNIGGVAHLSQVDSSNVKVRMATDNCAISGTLQPIAIRITSSTFSIIEDSTVLLQGRTNTNYAISISGCTDSEVRRNKTNYLRGGGGGGVVYVDGTRCYGYDNVVLATASVSFANGATAASNASMQRVA